MGTFYDNEGLHWYPISFFPWIETSRGFRRRRGENQIIHGRWFRRSPQVIEQCDGLHGEIMQTIKLKDGTEQVRRAYWLE